MQPYLQQTESKTIESNHQAGKDSLDYCLLSLNITESLKSIYRITEDKLPH